jgi:hypothetical protein
MRFFDRNRLDERRRAAILKLHGLFEFIGATSVISDDSTVVSRVLYAGSTSFQT